MASLRELQNHWQIRYYDSSRQPKETTDSLPKSEYTKAEAESEADWRQQLYDRRRYDPWLQEGPGLGAKPQQITLIDAVNEYIDQKRAMGERNQAGGWTEQTAKADGPILKKFARETGPQLLIHKLRTGHIQTYVHQEHLAEATQAGYYRRIKAMLTWWDEQGWIDEAPRMPAKPRTRKTIREVLSPEDLDTIERGLDRVEQRKRDDPHTPRGQVGRDWVRDVWRVCFYQGFRRGEVMQLRVRNVDLEERRVRVGDPDLVPKGKDEEIIPIVSEALPIFQKWLEGERDPGERVFRHAGDKVSRVFREAVDAAAEDWDAEDDPHGEGGRLLPQHRAEEINFYTLRHSCATYWLRQGKSLVWVQRLLRHSDISTTMEYVHLVPEDLLDM